MAILASQGWSAVNAIGAQNIQVGYAVTQSGDGARMVVADAAGLASSPSGRVVGVATTPASANQSFVFMQVGLLDKTQVPYVGAGNNTDYIVVDSSGRLVRSGAYSSSVIGIAGKDGSAFLLPALGNQIVIQNPGTNISFAAGTVSVGDVVTTDNGGVFGKVARATAAALAAGNVGFGIALTSASSGFPVIWAGPGSTVPAATVGLGAGVADWGIVANNRVARATTTDALGSRAPGPAFTIAGTIAANGDFYVMPARTELDHLVVGGPGYFTEIDGTTDVSAKIQAALDAAALNPVGLSLARGNLIVDMPRGWFTVNKPVQIKRPGTRLRGAGIDATSIVSVNTAITPLYCSPADRPFPVQTNAFNGLNAAIVTQANPPDEHYLNFSETGAGADLDGLAAFAVELKMKVTGAAPVDDNHIIVSDGTCESSEQQAFGIAYRGDSAVSPPAGALVCSLTTSVGGFHFVAMSATAGLNDGNWHEVAFTYDGAMIRIFVDGVVKASASVTGTIVQQPYEAVLFGRGAYMFCGLDTRRTQPPPMQVASLRMSAVARRTAGYTPVNAKFTADADTLILLNFDSQDGIHSVGSVRGIAGNTALRTAYWPNRYEDTPISGQTGELYRVEDLSVQSAYGPCIEIDNGPHSMIRDVVMTGRSGLRVINNSFLTKVDSIRMLAGFQPVGRDGLFFGDRCYGSVVRDYYITGMKFGVATVTDVDLGGSGYLLNNRRQYTAFQAGSVKISGSCLMTDEGSHLGIVMDYTIGLFGVSAVDISGIDGGFLEKAATPILIGAQNNINQHRNIFICANSLNVVSGQALCKIYDAVDGVIEFGPNSVFGVLNTDWTWLTSDSNDSQAVIVRQLAEFGHAALTMTDANRTLTANDKLYGAITMSGTLTATRSLFIRAAGMRRMAITNATGQTLNVTAIGGATPIALTAGSSAIFGRNQAATELIKL